ncbi:hypothetical protein FG379_002913 [Cryptosporidium bovis]|uniref:uncharacterized protein n=1 Tax=Cryptosporidium bovis TaxID=310047 RepID=UPI00351A4033|nr:hypothetical protein FG379_002913 [Cryptosporidium bovis]
MGGKSRTLCIFLFFGITLLISVSKITGKGIQLDNGIKYNYFSVIHESSLLKLKAVGGDDNKVHRVINVAECNPELFLTVQLAEAKASFFYKSFLCAVKKMEEVSKSCGRRCKLLRRLICRCRGISKMLQEAKQELGKYKSEYNRWSESLFFCIDCRVLTLHLLESGKRTSVKSTNMLSHTNSVYKYDQEELKQKLVKSELYSDKISYMNNNMKLLKSYVKELCKINRYVCDCAKRVLKNEIKEKKEMMNSIKDVDLYLKDWYNHNNDKTLGRPFVDIQNNCNERMSQFTLDILKSESEGGSNNIGTSRPEETKF